MKKFLLTLFLFVLALTLVACGGEKDPKGGEMNVAKAQEIYNATMENYSTSNGVDAKVTYNDGTNTSTIVFAYNLEGDEIKDLSYVVNNEKGELSIYVSDGTAYMNAYGTKTKVAMTAEDYATFKDKYSFASVVKEINVLFGVTFFGAAAVENATDGKVTLSSNLSLLQADPQLDEDAYFEAEQNIEKLQEKKALDAEMEYSNNAMTKFVGKVTEQDDTVKTFTIEFNGTTANITLPDLTGYEEVK